MTSTRKPYFPHIQGLRAVAALLVAVYHIHLDRISGGVDVFFVVSGVLVTLGLLRQADETGQVQWKGFLSGLALRLLPAAGVTLLLALALTFLFIPETRHPGTLREILAAALYVENWQLAIQQTDYLDRENPASPVQHFWAMSMQGQFYLVALLAFLLCFNPGRRSAGAVGTAYAAIFVVSLGYSVYQTHFGNQVWAYYDTFARVWEFTLGGLLALALSKRHTLSLPPVFGWAGLVAILACGQIFQVGAVFPGVAALLPTTAALLVILGGRSTSAWSVGTLLGSRSMVSLGSVSFGIYLLHWPLLVFYREAFEVPHVGLAAGMAIIAVSVAGAYALRHFVEEPFLRMRRRDVRHRVRAVALAYLPLFAMIAGTYLALAPHLFTGLAEARNTARHPGARVLDGGPHWNVDAEPGGFIPEPAVVKHELPRSYADGCHLSLREEQPTWCIYGEADAYSRTLAIVGSSHVAQWLPALEDIALSQGWRILYSTWSGCRFTAGSNDERCASINQSVLSRLTDIRPDLVFTTATVGDQARPSDGFLDAWAALEQGGIRVAALRGAPWTEDDVAECVSRRGDDIQSCGAPREDLLADEFDVSTAPDNVEVLDLSDYLCNADFCPAVVGNVLIYRDRHHLTVAYVESLRDTLEQHIVPIMEAAEPRRQIHDTGVARAVAGTLSCGPAGDSGPIEREIGVMLSEDRIGLRTGSWFTKDGDFERWKGRITDDAVHVTGRYRSGGGEIKTVSLSGVHAGRLELAGMRGPRACRFVSEEV